ncbi:MAG: 50S ribosomal protein L22 [Chlamydiae bacterium]|nr:50S ribosomal protein L22 [Chlamydiota bacterium]
MATAYAKSKYVRISPRKARLVADQIRGLNVADASLQLRYSHTKAGPLLKKTLDSAVANAENNEDLNRDSLKVIEVRVDEGSRMKRSKPKNKGGSHRIIKRTSHFTIVVGE